MWDNKCAVNDDRSGLPPPGLEHRQGLIQNRGCYRIMDQTNSNIGASSTEDKAATAIETAMVSAKASKDKGKPAGKAAPKQAAKQAPVVRQVATQAQRTVVTMETAARICPNEAVATKITRLYGLDTVDYHAIREATEEHLALMAKTLADNLGERFEKPLEMHMQRIVDGFVRSAHGAGMFYDGKAKLARDASSAIANEDRDEDRQGIDGTENRAQRACGFAAVVGLQAYSLLAAAHGAVDAYTHVCGRDWKPYEGNNGGSGQALGRRTIALQASAFNRD